jgi:hypothetical protein
MKKTERLKLRWLTLAEQEPNDEQDDTNLYKDGAERL